MAGPQPRLLQIADFERPRGGSFIALLAGVGREAAARGWRSEAVFFEGAHSAPWVADLEEAGVTIHFAPDSLRRSGGRLSAWLGSLFDESPGPTVAHSHFTGFDIALARAGRRRDDVKRIWHIHGPLPRSPYHVSRALIKQGLIGRSVDAILCPAPNVVHDAIARGAPRGRVHFVPSAIEVDEFTLADDDDRRAARAALGLDPDAKVILHFGWHWKLKGGALFIDALADLTAAGDDSVLAIERGGDQQYLEYARERGLGDRIRLIEPVPEARLLHAAADIQVASSLNEGMAYGVLESLATGTPVVATEIPGHAYVGEHVAACRIVSHDAAALADAVRATLSVPASEREREASEGRQWIADNLSVERLGAQLVDLYEDLLRGAPLSLPW